MVGNGVMGGKHQTAMEKERENVYADMWASGERNGQRDATPVASLHKRVLLSFRGSSVYCMKARCPRAEQRLVVVSVTEAVHEVV